MYLKKLFIFYEITNYGLFFTLFPLTKRLFTRIASNSIFTMGEYEYISTIMILFAFNLVDNYIFMKFYLQNIISAALQIKSIKLISSGVFIYIACQSKLFIELIIYLSLEVLSFYIIIKMENEKISDSYHQYNIRVGLDSRSIQKLLLTETIDFFKLVYVISFLSSSFINISVSYLSISNFSKVRETLVFLDYLLYYILNDKNLFYKLSCLVYSIIFIYNVYNGIKIYTSIEINNNLSFIINLTLCSAIIILLIIHLIILLINKYYKI